jgi:thiol-disulfide isomerase/thioredoxin
MKKILRIMTSILLFSVSHAARAAAADARASGFQEVPAEVRYKAVLKEFEDAKRDRYRAETGAKTEQERQELSKRPFDYQIFAEKMDRIARDNPRDHAALPPLVWVAVYTQGPLADRAIQTIRESHVLDPGIGSFAVQIGYIPAPGGDAILRAILARNHSRQAKGHACLALARKLKLQAEHSGSKEKSMLLDGESEALFEKVVSEFADVKGENGPLGEIARNGLFELHHLSLGKEAPEIAGEDDEGRRMKLSEFRGKVVVLDFWGEWCGPCRRLYPFERTLIKRMAGRPFVFLGINSDPYDARERVRARMRQEQNTWRYWVDGAWPGAIGATWNVQSWPTLYVLDARGIIRHKLVGSTEVAGLDTLVESLVERTEATSRNGKPAPQPLRRGTVGDSGD